ncbi:hypothetical protein GNI_042070 [Gregarina niphandrodes]|uniref:Uncharacterized protein n=1 Tax=Gregarina niphandrodes TaxID=110365 RepID=A0A023BA30_GRENI|nr:hypothetical protein GNI_042070 [Gregarina niphandrodes]EZG77546.1 hypothetical protein GNI_042070 [Gregarina niphandrodes]|eukprot:XP_011129501.1 hypothetical protein GNI_042070 [Gregarina niphandrodes]
MSRTKASKKASPVPVPPVAGSSPTTATSVLGKPLPAVLGLGSPAVDSGVGEKPAWQDAAARAAWETRRAEHESDGSEDSDEFTWKGQSTKSRHHAPSRTYILNEANVTTSANFRRKLL